MGLRHIASLILLPAGAVVALADGPSDPALQAELLAMVERDQELRLRMAEDPGPRLEDEIDASTSDHTARLRQIVAVHGWPGAGLVGKEGCRAAWLLLQHADDVAFQERCLPDLERAARHGELDAADLALTVDRVLVRRGRPQRYGTQLRLVGAGPDREPYPVEDPGGLARRREEMGLEPLEQYIWRLEEAYGAAATVDREEGGER